MDFIPKLELNHSQRNKEKPGKSRPVLFGLADNRFPLQTLAFRGATGEPPPRFAQTYSDRNRAYHYPNK